MSIPASVITRLATLGLSEAQANSVASMLTEVEQATEQKVGAELEARRASDRASRKERNRRYYDKHRKTDSDVLRRLKTPSDTGDPSRARVLPWEDSKSIIPPDEPNGSSTPKGVDVPKKEKRIRGSRLSEDWRPSNALTDFGKSLGFPEQRLARAEAEFIDYWRGVPGSRGTKLDWDATYRNRLREIAGRERIVPPIPAKQSGSLARVFVARGTAQWAAWLKHLGKQSMPAIERDGEYGWNFESEWPTDATVTNSPSLENRTEGNGQSRPAPEREGPWLQACGAG